MAFTAAVRTEMLKVFTNGSPTDYTTWYVSLHTADPGATGADELPSSNGYIRKTVSWSAVSGGASDNSAQVQFAASGGDWSQVSYFGIWNAETSGTWLGGGSLSAAKTITDGDTGTFAAGDLDLTIS